MEWNPLERLTSDQRQRLDQFAELLRAFNRRINLISREDEAAVFEHHVLHCLSLTYRAFPDGAVVADWGTGGGLPAIPLAIAMPDVRFIAVDAVGRKVQAVLAMTRRLELSNVEAWHGRAEAFDGSVDYSVSRATAPLVDLWSWHVRAARKTPQSVGGGLWQPGLVCLKGGDLKNEKRALPARVRIEDVPLAAFLQGTYFKEKVILAISSSADLS